MTFPLYTLVQNLTFSKKANNSMKNRARVTNNVLNNRYFLRYLSVTLTLSLTIKVFLKSLKTDFYVFAFFTKFLVIHVFNKYTIRYKIKFHVEIT